MKATKKRIHFYIPSPLLAKAQSLADSEGATLSEIVRRALTEYLKAQTRRPQG